MKEKFNFLQMIAAILLVVSFTYLTLKIHLTRETEQLDYIILLLILSAQVLLFFNGIINAAIHLYIPAIIMICLVSYILYIKLNNEI